MDNMIYVIVAVVVFALSEFLQAYFWDLKRIKMPTWKRLLLSSCLVLVSIAILYAF